MKRIVIATTAALTVALSGCATSPVPAAAGHAAPATAAAPSTAPASAAASALAAPSPTPSAAPSAAPASSAPAALSIAPGAQPVSTDLNDVLSLAWLEGCWAGNVNQRNFREQWTPVRGNMLLGVGSTVYQGKVQDYEYLRIEARPDGVFYVAAPSGKGETPFKLTSIGPAEDQATLYTFSNAANDFPQEIVYRRATGGWLYATIQGKLKGEDRKVIFPMRRVDCETGDLIRQ